MTGRPDTAVVVLNWQNAPDTIECLESLSRSERRVDVLVVDNGSQDGSGQQVSDTGLAHDVIFHGRNDGYAGGNNVGLRTALDRGYNYIAVLNNDTLVDPKTMDLLVEACAQAGAAAVSPRIVYADNPEQAWFAGGVIDHGLPRHLQAHELGRPEGVTPSETLSGCCVMAHADVWTSVGLFDERYFLIFEDSDWSARARAAGVDLLVVQEGVIRHKVSRSFAHGPARLLGRYFFVRNGLRYHAIHAPAHLVRFLLTWVVKPTLRSGGAPGSRRFAALGVFDAVRGRYGNAPSRTWSRAGRLATVDRS